MSQRLYELAKEAANKAVAYDNGGNRELAITHYLQAFDLLMSLVKYSDHKRLKELYSKRAEEYLNRTYELKEHRKAATVRGSGGSNPQEMDDEARNKIMSTILPEKPNVKWEDIAGLKAAKRAIEESIILPLKRPELFEGMPSWKGVLLFGPPGCGKTMVAKAAATECESTFFSLGSADLMVKWVGDSEQRVKALFDVARERQPSIIFLDEVDAIGIKRDGSESPVSTRILTQILQGMDGLSSKVDDRLMVLGATNRPWNIDSAMLRRFDKRIMVPLPDIEARKEIFRINFRKLPQLRISDDINIDEMGKLTEGYTGDDIKKICMDAWYHPIHELQERGEIETKNPRKVNRSDFVKAIKTRKSSVTPREIAQNNVWAKEVGAL